MSGALLVLMSRHPGDAIVQATLVQQLQVAGSDPNHVCVMHTATTDAPVPWFSSVIAYSNGGWACRNLSLFLGVVKFVRSREVSALYARDVFAFLVGSAACLVARVHVALLLDCRGDIAAEAELRGNARWRVRALRLFQQLAWRRADRIMTVTNAQADVVRRLVRNADVFVVPNLQPSTLPLPERWPNSPRVVYAGGAQAWQDADSMLRQLAEIQDRGIEVEVITRDGALARKAQGLDFNVSSGDREHVLARLRRATGSWMVRREAVAMNVASPVKLGEALVSGAIVIGSTATWERMQDLVADDLGVLLAEQDSVGPLCRQLHARWARGFEGRQTHLNSVESSWTLTAYNESLRTFFGLGPVG